MTALAPHPPGTQVVTAEAKSPRVPLSKLSCSGLTMPAGGGALGLGFSAPALGVSGPLPSGLAVSANAAPPSNNRPASAPMTASQKRELFIRKTPS